MVFSSVIKEEQQVGYRRAHCRSFMSVVLEKALSEYG